MQKRLKYKKIETLKEFALFRDSLISTDEYDQQSEMDRFRSIQEADRYVENRLRTFFHDCVLVLSEHEEYVGYAYSYDYRFYDNHCKLCVRIRSDYRADNILVSTVILDVAKYLFRYYPLQKIFSEVCSSNNTMISAYITAGFTEELVLIDYIFQDGKYHNMSILGLGRGEYDSKILSDSKV